MAHRLDSRRERGNIQANLLYRKLPSILSFSCFLLWCTHNPSSRYRSVPECCFCLRMFLRLNLPFIVPTLAMHSTNLPRHSRINQQRHAISADTLQNRPPKKQKDPLLNVGLNSLSCSHAPPRSDTDTPPQFKT